MARKKMAPKNTVPKNTMPKDKVPKTPPAAPSALMAWLRHAALPAATMALVAAATMIPGESAVREGSHVVVTMAWLLLPLLWLIPALRGGRWAQACTWADVAVLVFLVWVTASGCVMLDQGHGRPTLNALGLWWSYGAAYYSIRQGWVRAVPLRALVACLMALAVGLSAMAGYQYAISMPQLRAEFEQNPDAALRRAGIDGPDQVALRQQFLNRLQSTEPMGPFALTNSLAGVLVPAWLIAFGLLVAGRLRHWGTLAGLALVLVVVGGCLLLTKSRSALLAVMFVSACWLAWRLGVARLGGGSAGGGNAVRWGRRGWLLLFGSALVGGLALALALGWGGWDRQVLTEAPKSLRYRLEYWQATLAMAGDYPWFGCGPGNFKEFYTAYKLPAASESISDPHNWLLEVAGTAGWPALAAVVAAGLAWVGPRRGAGPCGPDSPTAATGSDDGPPAAGQARPAPPADCADPAAGVTGDRAAGQGALAGLVVGMILAFPMGWSGGMGPDVLVLVTCLPVCLAMLALFWPWIVRGNELPRWVIYGALAGLLIHLLAAGGLTFPGVGLWIWCLAAASQANRTCPSPSTTAASQVHARVTLALATFLCVGSAGAAYLTVYRPQLVARGYLVEASDPRRWRELESLFDQAAAADRWWSEPCEFLAQLGAQRLAQGDPDHGYALIERGARQALRRNPRSSSLAHQAGNWLLTAYDGGAGHESLSQAVSAYQRAVACYPNSGLLHAQLAWAYHLAGRRSEAADHARIALQLDAQMPHLEFKLARHTLYGGQAGGDAEQRMVFLRNMSGGK